MSANKTLIIETSAAAKTAAALRKLYFIRVAFSVAWVISVALLAKTSFTAATILLVIYPLWDVVGTLLDLRANQGNGTSVTPQYVNLAISIITTIGVGVAIGKGVPSALIVFGAWALLTGLIQLILGLKKAQRIRRTVAYDIEWRSIHACRCIIYCHGTFA